MTLVTPPHAPSEFLRQFLMFCKELRHAGIKATLSQEIDACHALEFIDVLNHRDFCQCLKANLVSRKEDAPIFEAIFAKYWGAIRKDAQQRELAGKGIPGGSSEDRQSLSQEGSKSWDITPLDLAGDLEKASEATQNPIHSPFESLQEKDFSAFDDHDMEVIKKAIASITRKMRLRESYRKKAVNKARVFDLRRTIRKNIRHGGELVRIAWKSGKITKTRIVLLCDVSGSMERYSRFLIQFLYGLQRSLYNLETFVFSTRLSRLTPILRKEGFEKALEKISRTVLDWSGGTRIGECLRLFNRQYGSSLLYRKTIVMVISDGWDQGDERLLREEMKRVRKKAFYLIWLNPLLGYPQYQPICKGMKTALPFLDQFLPLHNVTSLMRLGQALYQIH